MTHVDIDVDIWRDGRNVHGLFDNGLLRDSYPYIDYSGTKFLKDQVSLKNILFETFEPDFNGLYPFMLRNRFVFFQTKEDAELFRGLLYIY
ncbi:hypothetical protein [Mesorhizobium sp. M4B.F.Ca.ET.058.02.1.1]|uniref:hypothetical protein n=1 Tax=Mesorhizobium sp. M4B.F.Ca.ET.058.02.1.1 TaxID=2493675 RepID=UPI000F7652EC|nr:hypothetical protein [Mesorhizobium sp. M4B.F.Ca.ET.058.02.1.1]AZO48082.1 hypothetical protein EJ073_09825 [Mesorhizobium sp. M4B.F.Ca.ET.058.02.1.1]